MSGMPGPIMPHNVGSGALYAADPRMQKAQLERAKMEEASQSFEAQYIFQLLELMAPPVGEGGLSGAGFAEETFRPQLHEAIANQVVKQGGFGLANHVMNELVAAQERYAPTLPAPAQPNEEN